MKKSYYFIIVFVLLLFLPRNVIAEQYTLSRGSVMYSDGTIVDSLQSGWDISGTMSIIGNRATQTLEICNISCISGTVSGTLLSYGENYHSVRVLNDNGIISEIVLLNAEYLPILTQFHSISYSEVDQWIPSSWIQSNDQDSVNDVSNTYSLSTVGGALEELLNIVNR